MNGFIDRLKQLAADAHKLRNYELNNEVENVTNTYMTMLQYMIKGVDDPNISQMYQQLRQRIVTLELRCDRMQRIAERPADLYSVSARNITPIATFENMLLSFESDIDSKAEDMYTIRLFHYVWTSDQWTRNDYEQASHIMLSEQVSTKVKSVFVSALTYACLEYFDYHKMMMIFDAYLDEDIEINQRAMIGIILICREKELYIKDYPDVASRLSIYCDDEDFRNDFYNSMIQLQFECNTPKIMSKMVNDILPTIANSSRLLKRKMGMLDLSNEMTKNGENPDWTAAISEEDEEKMRAKMQEMADLQIDGADIYMSTFSMFKNYPFFSEIAHWFYPFDIDDPSLGNISDTLNGTKGKYLLAMLNAGPFSNSDKYSFCFIGNTMGPQALEAFTAQLEDQYNDQGNGEDIVSSAINRRPKKNDVRRRYIFDLYRFHKLFPRHPQFDNVFLYTNNQQPKIFSPIENDIFSELSNDHDNCYKLAEFMMRQENYVEAQELFTHIQSSYISRAEYWQKLGFCMQKRNLPSEAEECYSKAEVIQSDSKWTLSHLGHVAIINGNYERALKAYSQLIEIDPDSVKYLYRKAQCYIHLKKYDEALPLLQKSYYLDDTDTDIRQQVALTLAHLKRVDDAIALYHPILPDYKALEFMTLSVLYLIKGNMPMAHTYLTQSTDLQDFDKEFDDIVGPFIVEGKVTTLQCQLLLDTLSV